MSPQKKDLPEAKDPSAFVKIAVFDGGLMVGPGSFLVQGLNGVCNFNSWRFLITHEPSATKLWFDLGLSSDLAQYSDHIRANQVVLFKPQPPEQTVLENARSVGVEADSIKHVIISHAHWDHVYPVGSFFPKANVICGPGSRRLTAESWPEHADSPFDSRVWNPDKSELPLRELPGPEEAPDGFWQRLGPFEHAHDFFGDGSFWLLRSPGHYPGHMVALARTRNKAGERRFVLLAADALHCYHLLHYPAAPFGKGLPLNKTGTIHEDVDVARRDLENIAAVQEAYGKELFVWPAHVDSLEGIWEF
ncbi:hypothetical protein L249_4802 [Ophiocordyceps polyrhachis-furcata BCC 54312]|uniref:Metallo-beta-lactamase domain-containing protein n=1 Tax=Ophiocordyceps polyrhachis-furcata BCC 54312 TaxID=1330021 RepID=A0A367L365_9HYPO|nr:hypothetical protein L249_4802 [Ophiocordyceps polyrhachis-furcata BCC 54312]